MPPVIRKIVQVDAKRLQQLCAAGPPCWRVRRQPVNLKNEDQDGEPPPSNLIEGFSGHALIPQFSCRAARQSPKGCIHPLYNSSIGSHRRGISYNSFRFGRIPNQKGRNFRGSSSHSQSRCPAGPVRILQCPSSLTTGESPKLFLCQEQFSFYLFLLSFSIRESSGAMAPTHFRAPFRGALENPLFPELRSKHPGQLP